MISSASQAPSILVVDDEDATRNLVALALRRAGFDVVEAPNGRVALELVQVRTIALVVLDMGMPGMSGIEVIQAFRSRAETATLPILLLTGSDDGDGVIKGLDAGADDFLSKPARLDELVARITAHLRRQSAWSEVMENELRNRASVVAALARLAVPPVPEEAGEAVVRELARRTGVAFVAVLQVGVGGVQELATYDRSAGVQRGGRALGVAAARQIVARAREGPWVEEIGRPGAADTQPLLAPPPRKDSRPGHRWRVRRSTRATTSSASSASGWPTWTRRRPSSGRSFSPPPSTTRMC